ncbi:MAG: nitroreductase family protein [Bacteroidales bacterium]|nr:nitroreductase family protein [Bacteroidales bacterium]
MADGYLEDRMNEFISNKSHKTIVKRISIDSLLERNRSCRGYNPAHVITREMLEKIAEVNTKIPSARNQQCLRFRLVTRENGADSVLRHVKMGGALPELHLPLPGTQPEAFIIVCSTEPESKMVDIDLGISAQSMLLKATEMGLCGLIIGAFDKNAIEKELDLPYPPLLILAIGKGIETIRIAPIHAGESQQYYRKNGIHYVPKLQLRDLLLPDTHTPAPITLTDHETGQPLTLDSNRILSIDSNGKNPLLTLEGGETICVLESRENILEKMKAAGANLLWPNP